MAVAYFFWRIEGELNITSGGVAIGGRRIGLSHKSHNAPVPYSTMHHSEHECVYVRSQWGIVGYGTGTLRDLWA